MPHLGISVLEFENNIVIFEISTFKFIRNESLTHTVNFGIGSAFSKGPGPGPGLLCKVCPVHYLTETANIRQTVLQWAIDHMQWYTQFSIKEVDQTFFASSLIKTLG